MKSKEDTPTPTSEEQSLNPGQTPVPKVVSKYQISYLIGEGGMGRVYRARDPVLMRDLAVKLLSDNIVNVSQIQRFQREAKAMGKLDHQGIVGAYDFGVDEKHGPYLVMEFVDGEDLDTFIKKKGSLSGAEFIEIFSQILDALAHAHSHNIIHRDLKPGNILVSKTDEGLKISILDFGIAKILEHADQLETKTGTMIGSPKYMSPEQIKGKKLDPRSDIYSLGCVMFAALTGSPPFKGKTMLDTFEMHQSEPVPALKTVPEDLHGEKLEKMIHQALAKNADQRFKNVGQFKTALNAVQKKIETEDEVVESVPIFKSSIGKGMILGIVSISLLSIGVVNFVFNKNFSIKPKSEADHKKSITRKKTRMALDDQGLDDIAKDKEHARRDFRDSRRIMFNGHPFIEYKSFAGNDESFSRFLEKQKNMKNLVIAKAGIYMTGKALSELPPSLERLVIFGKDFEDDYIERFPKLVHLKSLFVRTVDQKEAINLFKMVPEKFPNLERLVLDHSDVTDDDLKLLSSIVTLKDIGLTRCNKISGKGFSHLAKLPKLEFLHLNTSNNIDPAYLKSFKGAPLDKLNLFNVKNIDDSSVELLAELKLKEIIIKASMLSESAKEKLKKLSPGTTIVEI